MKTLLLTIVLCFTMQANAFFAGSPDQLNETEKAQLLEVLNQMEPEVLERLLSEEALDWYLDQFTRGAEDTEMKSAEVTHGKVDVTDGVYYDPNAPVFN